MQQKDRTLADSYLLAAGAHRGPVTQERHSQDNYQLTVTAVFTHSGDEHSSSTAPGGRTSAASASPFGSRFNSDGEWLSAK